MQKGGRNLPWSVQNLSWSENLAKKYRMKRFWITAEIVCDVRPGVGIYVAAIP